MKLRLFKFAAICLASLLFLLTNIKNAVATTEFLTNYQGLYQIEEDGSTYVTHTITLTNNLSHIFPRTYTLAVGSTKLTDLTATDGSGKSLELTESESDTQTSLIVKLLDPNIGQNQMNTIKLSYKASDVVIKNGKVWEINIPRLKQGGEMSSVERIVVFPLSLGSPVATYPTPDKVKSDEHRTTITYNTSRQEAISLLFGDNEWYHLKLDYFLDKPLTKNAVTEMSLPPDTAYQQVIIESLDPAPSEIVLDKDGNWLARYPYSENFQNHVVASLFVNVSPIPKFKDPSATILDDYTKSHKYWETNSAIVKQTAEQLRTPENIYNYLVSSFTYNKNRVTPGADRLGAEKALTSPSMAICTEFTDSFVALARALNIPSREINGYALTSNSTLRPLSLETDVLHAWPEYYDQESNIWRSIDPTWGNTTGGLNYFKKLDYNHIVFVRHGVESTYPYPAGVYKKSVQDKTVFVELSQVEPVGRLSYELTKVGKDYEIKNNGNQALIDYSIKLPDGSAHTVSYLPPYGKIKTTSLLGVETKSSTLVITISLVILALILALLVVYLTKKKMLHITRPV